MTAPCCHRPAPLRRAARLLGGLLLSALALLLPGCSGSVGPPAPPPPTRRPLLSASPAELSLEAVPQGGRKVTTFTLVNTTSSQVEVVRASTSCPCLTV